MVSPYKPAIVIAAFNRVHSLGRLLSSLDRAMIPDGVTLVISIDNNGQNKDVLSAAEEFRWRYGKKEVQYQPERLGLRRHILKCGDLTRQYGSVIMLEDDLVVSPYFYSYAVEAAEYYDGEDRVAGISLYNQPYTENVKLPFHPVRDDADTYFMKMTSSYGQLWTERQWASFREYYDGSPDPDTLIGLPMLIKQWPETSWKKYYCAYLVASDRYFVYPYLSYTTNFSDPGSNFIYRSHFGQTQVAIFDKRNKFIDLDRAIAVYDAYGELLPDRFKQIAPVLAPYDLEIDLYGKKESFSGGYVLTSKRCRNPILAFERSMKPHELNIVFNIQGNDIRLVRTEDVLFYPGNIEDMIFNENTEAFLGEYGYFFQNVHRSKVLFRIIMHRFSARVRSFAGKNSDNKPKQ